MGVLCYLWASYSELGSDSTVGGPLVLYPVIMNHERATHPAEANGGVEKGYWRELEKRLAAAYKDLSLLRMPKWERSVGVVRKAALWADPGKPFPFISGVDEPRILPPHPVYPVGRDSL